MGPNCAIKHHLVSSVTGELCQNLGKKDKMVRAQVREPPRSELMVVCTNSPPATFISTQAPPASVAAPPAVSLFWQVLHTSHHPEIPDPIQIQFTYSTAVLHPSKGRPRCSKRIILSGMGRVYKLKWTLSVCLSVITPTFPLKALLNHSGRLLDLICHCFSSLVPGTSIRSQ